MILVTAFEPFGAAATNASEDLLRALADDPALFRAILPTEYDRAAREIVRLIRELSPAAVICFGVATRAEMLRLERVARNWDVSTTPDNAGDIRSGQAIASDAPDTYAATLPYDSISAALSASNIPHVFSDDAGGYVCNHTFFSARHEIEQSGGAIPCGFVHVPPILGPEQFAALLEAVKICVRAVADVSH
jgi:pyroglutamyl-peptidase